MPHCSGDSSCRGPCLIRPGLHHSRHCDWLRYVSVMIEVRDTAGLGDAVCFTSTSDSTATSMQRARSVKSPLRKMCDQIHKWLCVRNTMPSCAGLPSLHATIEWPHGVNLSTSTAVAFIVRISTRLVLIHLKANT
jgi:hypothetical protein